MKKVVTLTIVLAACTGSPAAPPPPATTAQAPVPLAAQAGVAHADVITSVILAPEADAALTVDRAGSVRYWPSLDGTAPARLMPMHDPRQMSLGPLAAGGRLVATISGSDNVELGSIDAAGDYQVAVRLPPRVRAYDVRALAGDQVAVLGKDNIIDLVAKDGKVLARWERPGFRPAQLLASADGKRLVAIMVDEKQDQTFPGEARALVVGPGTLTDGPAREFSFRPIASTPDFDLSADGGRLIMLERGADRPALVVLPLGEGEPRRIPLPSAAWPDVARFIDDTHVIALAPQDAPGWAINLAASPAVTPRLVRKSGALDPVPASVAGGAGRLVQAAGAFLRLSGPGDDETFLGHIPLKPELAAISPSGQRLASTSRGGKGIVLDQVGASTFAALPGDAGHPTALAFLDEGHLLVADMSGHLRTLDLAGKVTDETTFTGLVTRLSVDPASGTVAAGNGTRLVALFHPSGGHAGPAQAVPKATTSGLTTLGGATSASWQVVDGKATLVDDKGQARPFAVATGEVFAVDPDGGTWTLTRASAPDPAAAIIAVEPAATAADPERIEGRVDSLTITQAVIRTTADGKVLWRLDLPVGSTHPEVGARGELLYSTFLGVVAVTGPDGKERWSRRLDQAPRVMTLSADGARLLVATGSGLLVLDSKSGKTLYQRCGSGFIAAHELPAYAEPPGTLGTCSL
jgi:hypothetical protein